MKRTPLKPSKKPLRRRRKGTRTMLDERILTAWALNCKHRAEWVCEHPDCTTDYGLEAHHVKPKGSFGKLRYDRQNMCCLCARHHRYEAPGCVKDSTGFTAWFKAKRPEDHAYLNLSEHQGPAYRTIAELEAIAENLESDNALYERMGHRAA